MATTYWRPRCWNEVGAEEDRFPACWYDITVYAELPYEEKLLLALRHPVRDSRVRAVRILGQRRAQVAIPA